MPLTKTQKIVADSKARFRVAACGRRWGKSALGVREIAKAAIKPNSNVMYVAPSYQMCRNIIWRPLKTKLTSLNWVSKINESRLEITLTNNSLIMLRGADNEQNLRGVGLDFLCCDEIATMKSEAWTEVLRPTLADKEGSALFIGTPKGIGNHFYELFTMAQTHDDWESFSYTTLEGANVSEEEVQTARDQMDPKTFSQEFEASFEIATNLVYYAFKSENNVKKWDGVVDDLKSIYVLTDFGVSPMATVIAVPTKTGLFVIDEVALFSSNTDEMIQEVRNRYPQQTVTCWPDPAGVQRRSSSGGRTDISILQNAGWNVKYKPRHPAVKDRVNAVNSLLLNSNGESRLFVDPKCKELIKSLGRFSYKEGTLIPDKGGKNDYSHFPDALGYGVEYLFPVTRQFKTQSKQTFGMY
jgi:hypothetical protein